MDAGGTHRRGVAHRGSGRAGAILRHGLPQRHELRALARGLQEAGQGPRHHGPHARGRRAADEVRPDHRQQGSRRARLRADLPRVLRPHDREVSHRVGDPETAEDERHVRPHRTGLRRARARAGRVLGAGDGFRCRHRQPADADLGHDARLRLPPHRAVHRAAPRGAQDHPARRPDARADDRPARRRARADAIPADALFRLWRRLRRRWPPRPPALDA